MLTPMAPLIPPHNANFGSMDSNSRHLLPFVTPHISHSPFLPVAPVYPGGMLPYSNNIRLTTVLRSNLLEEFRTRKSRKWELTVSPQDYF
jgi:pumilio RNA-binding family